MKYCWSHIDNEIGIGAPGAVLLSVIYLSAMFTETYRAADPMKHLLVVGCFGFPVIAFLLLTAFVCARRYRIDAEGMTLSYPFGITVRHRWTEFSEVALCKIHYASAGNAHIPAIRCVIGEEKRGPR